MPLALLVAAVVPVSSAQAQSVDDLQTQAAQIQTQMAALRDEVEAHAEDYNRARAQSDADQAELDLSTKDLDTTRAEFDQRRQQLANYAVQAYVEGGDLPSVDGLLGGDPDVATRRLSYLETASGDRRSLLDRLNVAQQDLDTKLQRVRTAQAAAEDDAHRADEARQSAADAEGQLNSLLGQVQGQLADLVQQEAQRQAAADAAAAQAAAAQANAAPQQVSTDATAGDTLGAASSASDDSASTARAPLAAVGASASASTALQAAYSQLGVPYVYGGASPDEGFDCSGLMMWAYGQAGVSLPHPADYQRDDIQPISESQLQPGDLIFYGEPPSHVAMYAGGGQIINAPYTGEVVRMQDMYYSSKPMTFGRVN